MIAWVDAASGVSGDKLLAALLDAGAPFEAVRSQVAALDLPDWDLRTERAARGGVAGLALRVTSGDRTARTWADIRAMLVAAPLAPATSAIALRAFALLAEAEAAVHGVAVEDVHFHEVGAVDSIIDIVGAAAAVASLDVSEIHFSPLALGGGSIEARHGTLPVPAPATALLLEGVPCFGGSPEMGELTTPTGAALAVALATAFGPMPAMVVAAVGHGAGSREIPRTPNILRVLLGESASPGIGDEEVVLLETNVDHISPEILALALERVMEQGALDVWQTPIVMKKGRAAAAVTVLCRPEDEARTVTALMAGTGTLGVRRRVTRRWVAERETARVATSLGRVRVKRGAGAQRIEADDVARVAKRTGLPPADVARSLAGELADPAE